MWWRWLQETSFCCQSAKRFSRHKQRLNVQRNKAGKSGAFLTEEGQKMKLKQFWWNKSFLIALPLSNNLFSRFEDTKQKISSKRGLLAKMSMIFFFFFFWKCHFRLCLLPSSWRHSHFIYMFNSLSSVECGGRRLNQRAAKTVLSSNSEKQKQRARAQNEMQGNFIRCLTLVPRGRTGRTEGAFHLVRFPRTFNI